MISENVDVLIEIFLWLPAKSLIKFKLVCKQWLSLISDPHFSHSHTIHSRRSKPEPSLLLHRPKSSQCLILHGTKLVQYHFPTILITPTICSFSNGLFLLRCDSLETAPVDCYVYNPTTRQSRKISLNVNERYTCVMGINIAFDPVKSNHFKVICVRAARRRTSGIWRSWWRRCQIEMFESDIGTWKICGESFMVPRELDFDRGVYWNDAIHWRGLYFNLNTNKIGEHPIIMAREDYGADAVENYVEVNGCLNCIAHFTNEKVIEVFELQSDYHKWSTKFRISFDRDSHQHSLMGIVWGETEADSKLVVYESGKVMTCGFEDKIFEEVIGFKEDFYDKRYESRFDFQFLETLAPV